MVDCCETCPLSETATQRVHGTGPKRRPEIPIMFVGEAPGKEEDKEGRPFVGVAGKNIFNPMLRFFGLTRKKCHIYNVLLCRPPDNKISSKEGRAAVKLCPGRYLFPAIAKHKPAVIVAMGATAVKVLLNETGVIKDKRGIPRRVTIEEHECVVIPTYHPAALIPSRNPQNKYLLYTDVDRALNIATRGYKPIKERYWCLDTLKAVKAFMAFIQRKNIKLMSYDIESQLNDNKNVDVHRDKVLGIGFSWADGKAAYIPIRTRPNFSYSLELFWDDDHDFVIDQLKVLLENNDFKVAKGGQNKKYDNKVLYNDLGIKVKGVKFDTMLASHALDENQMSHALDEQVRIFIPEKHGWKSAVDYKDMAATPLSVIAHYCNTDADMERRLCGIHNRRLKRYPKLRKTFFNYVMPLQDTVQRMEQLGAPVDMGAVKKLSGDLDKECRRLELKMREKFGRTVKVDSADEVLTALYDEGVDISLLEEKDYNGNNVLDNKGRKKYKTDKNHLDLLGKESKLAQLVLNKRAVDKMKSTYVDPIMRKAIDSWIHTSFLLHGTVTGRPASRAPNLLNITHGGEDVRKTKYQVAWGKRVKSIYRAPKGCYIIEADQSQMEVRSFAYYAGDKELVKACTMADVHLATACSLYELDYDESVIKYKSGDKRLEELRWAAKSVTFLVFYGGSAEAAAKLLHIDIEIVEAFVEAYFERFVGADAWIKLIHKLIDRDKVVVDAFGWMRRIPYAGQKGRVGEAHRQAVNSIIQGFSVRVCLMQLIEIEQRFIKEGLKARPSLAVYDSIIPMNVPKDELEDTIYVMNDVMTTKPLPDFNVPLKAGFSYGELWSELEDFELAA